MLPLKESKQLVKPIAESYTNPFDIQMIQSADKSKLIQVEIDPVNHLIYLTLVLDDQSLIVTLDAEQAVNLGQWCLESGYVVNFVEKSGISFEEEEVNGT